MAKDKPTKSAHEKTVVKLYSGGRTNKIERPSKTSKAKEKE